MSLYSIKCTSFVRACCVRLRAGARNAHVNGERGIDATTRRPRVFDGRTTDDGAVRFCRATRGHLRNTFSPEPIRDGVLYTKTTRENNGRNARITNRGASEGRYVTTNGRDSAVKCGEEGILLNDSRPDRSPCVLCPSTCTVPTAVDNRR